MSQAFYQQVSALLRDGNAASAVQRLQEWLQEKPDDEIGLSLYGSALLRCGDDAKALEVFRRATETHAKSFAAFGDLGFALLQSGHRDDAVRAFARAVKLNPSFYAGLVLLSRLQYEAGDVGSALEAFKQADRNDPFAEKFTDVQTLMREQRFADAEKACRSMLQMQPGYPRAAYTLAKLASQVGAFEEASRILQQALQYYPADINLRSSLVVSHEESGLYEQALSAAKALLELDTNNPAAWLIVGRVHGHCGNYDDCLQAYDQALQLSRDDAEIGNIEMLRGHILKILGRYDDGIAAYRASAAKIRGNGAAWWGLADMKTHRFDDSDIESMQAIVNDLSIKQEQRTQAAFALGKAYEDRQDYDAAFASYSAANSLRTGIEFDPATQQTGIAAIIAAYTTETLALQAEPLANGPTPIFILGLPRSGSTLIEQILASHSLIEGTMELANLPNLLRQMTIDGGRKGKNYPESIALFDAAELASYGQKYLDDTAMYRTGKAFFIDKLPTNFDKVGLIHKILPQAIIIDARRDPLDCGLSCFKQHFAGGHQFSYSLQNIGAYYNSYLRMMRHWNEVLPGKVLLAQYEDTIADTDAAVRALLAHCGVPFEEGCLRFFDNKRPVRTASSEQVRQPIYNKGVGYWRNFDKHLEPLRDALQRH